MQHNITKKIALFIIINFYFSVNVFSQKDLYAGIEIGSKGVKFSVIDVQNIKKGKYEIITYWTENIGIAKGISINGSLAKEDIDKASSVVLKNLYKLKNTYKVLDENIFVVASSGVGMANNMQELIDEIKRVTRKDLDYIDAATEGKMLLKGSIPPKKFDDAIILDIGGGNTKGGYIDVQNNDEFVFFSLKLDYGTITLTEAINKTNQYNDIEDIEVFKRKAFSYNPMLRESVANMINTKPAALRKNEIYLSGGALWAFTTLYYNKETDDHFIPIKMSDILEYDAVLKNNYSKIEEIAKNSKNANAVLKTYNQRYLISANTILIACLEAIPDLGNKKIFFAKEGQIAWLVSYVVDRTKRIKNNF